MEGAATALGLVIGIRIGRRFVADVRKRSRALILALIFAIIVFLPLLHACAAAARLGWSASESSTWSRIADHVGYAAAKQLDKILIASVYFLKIVGFALLAGLALSAVAVVSSLMIGTPRAESTG
jgi:amino acid transporter